MVIGEPARSWGFPPLATVLAKAAQRNVVIKFSFALASPSQGETRRVIAELFSVFGYSLPRVSSIFNSNAPGIYSSKLN